MKLLAEREEESNDAHTAVATLAVRLQLLGRVQEVRLSVPLTPLAHGQGAPSASRIAPLRLCAKEPRNQVSDGEALRWRLFRLQWC